MAVVLVDGWPTDKVEEASRLARESGINIFFVTIEGPDDNEKQNLIEANFVDKVEYCHRGVCQCLIRRCQCETQCVLRPAGCVSDKRLLLSACDQLVFPEEDCAAPGEESV